jgi:hypothetical protein
VTSGEQHRGHGLNEVDFEILAGLPASGPAAVAFPASNLGFSEGLVIRVRPTSTEAWTGNFQCGENDHTAVYIHPDGKRLIVIAGGSDYLVDPRTKELMGQTTDNISFSCEVPELEIIVFITFGFGRRAKTEGGGPRRDYLGTALPGYASREIC